MSQSLLVDALAAGVIVVTPNNRLARDIALRYDESRRAQGLAAWSAAQVLPWALWLDRLWLEALAAHAGVGRVLLDAGAARELWYAVVKDERRKLLNSRGAARHAMDAWTQFHAWRLPNESPRSVAAGGAGDDVATFSLWCDRYQQRLDALAAIDPVQLPDALALAAPSIVRPSPRILLHAFLPITPQQRRLVDALKAAGATIDETPPIERTPTSRHRTSAPTPLRETARALAFARERVAGRPDARVAIVVANLHERRGEVEALAEEILCAERLLALEPDSPRPYGISLGEPLASVPIIACALALIAVASGPVDAATAAALVRAPFLPDAAAHWTRRGGVEETWRKNARRDVGWSDIVGALCDVDPALHRRFSAAAPPSRANRLPRDWARSWSDWLDVTGWPGTTPLTSAQWQAREAWTGVVARFAATGAVTGVVPASSALETLRTLLEDTLFQPEAAPAQVQILGSLEAVGLSFDCAWLAGFDAQRWPPPATPSPFLPLRWQHARGVPRAHPDSALAHAQAMTNALAALAPEIIVSYAALLDDAPAVISPLFETWPLLNDEPPATPGRRAEAIGAVSLERIADERAPAIPAGTYLRGGAQLFDSQSACPFKAFARFRLRADAWPACPDGLSAAERGIVLHAMLTAFWDDVRDHATLAALAPATLQQRIDASIDAGKAKLAPARWRALPAAVAEAESHRLATTMLAWLVEHELPRPAFVARANEHAIETDVEGIAVKVRVDRIDELATGGLAIVDYKSGRVPAPARWFAPRPEGIQLAVYAHAIERTTEAPIRALAFAKLKAGEIEVRGIADRSETWPALEVAGASARVPAWSLALATLRGELATLAREVRDGVARVAPRHPSTCQYCGLQPLCRVRLLDDGAAFIEAADD
jgi:probable DNA repair protein